MTTATITSKGQVTIPRQVREALGLRAGDRLLFEVREDGTAIVRPGKRDPDELAGSVKPGVTNVSLEEMQRAVEEGAQE